MPRFLNPDNSAFQISLNSEIYVDKTELIKYTNSVLETPDGYICNSRPRRFGKSYAANMLTAYYSKGADSLQMFSDLLISKDHSFKRYLNKYDVIHIDIQWFVSECKDKNKIVSYISDSIMKEVRFVYSDILPDDSISLADALSCIREMTGNKFIFIIDEWDVLIRDDISNEEIQNEYIQFLRGLFKGTEPTRYIALAYLTGILPIKKEKTESSLNNFNEFTMLDAGPLAPFVGFTEKEVQHLCVEYHRDFQKVKSWYDGYLLDGYQIYNPKAVVNLMKFNKFKSYWSDTGSYEAVVPLISMNFDGLRQKMIEMLSGSEIKFKQLSFGNDPSLIKNSDDVMTYLIHLGYLGYNGMDNTAFIPNEEIRQELDMAVQTAHWNELQEFETSSNILLDATLDMDEITVGNQIEKIHNEYISVIKYNDENSLSCVLTLAYLSTMQYYFKPVREMPSGRGFCDFLYIPKSEYKDYYPALVVELKWNKKVVTAIEQIKQKKYTESILEYTSDILLVGISYDKNTKVHECKIEKYNLNI